MALPTPPPYSNPIPNNPFYSPETTFFRGPYYPAIIDSSSGIQVDADGYVVVTGGGGSGVTSIVGGAGISVSANTGAVTVTNTGVLSLVAGSGISLSSNTGAITITATGGTGTVTSVSSGTGLTGGPITTSGTLSLADTAVSPGSYTLTNLTVDQQGRITAASNGTAVTQITAGTGLTGGTITSTGTINLADTAVTPGAYTYGSFTVDQQGRLTAAASGTPPVASVAVTSPIVDTGTATVPNIGVQTATTGQLGVVQVGTNIQVAAGVISVDASSTSQSGIVQLNDTLTSSSTTEALTAAQGKVLQDQISALSASSNLTLAGTFDAAAAQMLTVTSSGSGAGFAVGSDLPAPVPGLADYFVIVTTAGSYSPPGGGGPYSAIQGDWFLCNGTAWEFLNVGNDLPVASTGTAGIVELADTAETQAGTDATLAVTPAGAAATYVAKADYTAKGDILSASGASTPVALGVGADGQVLFACAATATGLCWSNIATATPTLFGTVKGCTDATNTALGCSVLTAITTGTNNVAIGCGVAPNLTTGSNNVAIGCGSLAVTCTGNNNVAIGGALGSTNSLSNVGNSNIGIGLNALGNQTTGSNHIALGARSGFLAGAGNNSIFIGQCAGAGPTDPSCSLFLGFCAGAIGSGTTACTVLIGPNVQATPDGFGQTSCQLAIGYGANKWLTGFCDLAIKPGAGIIDCASSCGTAGQFLASTGANGIEWVSGAFIPCSVLTAKGDLITTTTPDTPVVLPVGADGQALIACAASATGLCWANATASPATPVVEGTVFALTEGLSATLDGNTALGCCALRDIGTAPAGSGFGNVAIGFDAGKSLVAGFSNVAVGEAALSTCVGPEKTVAIGSCAGSASQGCCNTLIGHFAGRCVAGCNNVIIGAGMAATTAFSGDCNVLIGTQCNPASFNASCQLAIGFGNNYWLTGDSSRNIRPGAGIVDCSVTVGTACEVLRSTGTAIEWSSVGSSVGRAAGNLVSVQLDNLLVRYNNSINMFEFTVATGTASFGYSLVTTLQSSIDGRGAASANVTAGTWRAFSSTLNLTARGNSIVAQMVYISGSTVIGYTVTGMRGTLGTTNDNIINITRLT